MKSRPATALTLIAALLILALGFAVPIGGMSLGYFGGQPTPIHQRPLPAHAAKALAAMEQGLADGSLTPNLFSDNELEVLAALPEEERVTAAWVRKADLRLFFARGLALTARTMQGDPSEIAPFLEHLETDPPPRDPTSSVVSDEVRRDRSKRRIALRGLLKAAVHDSEYGRETYERIAAQARRHARMRGPDINLAATAAGALLHLLRRGLVEEAFHDRRIIDAAFKRRARRFDQDPQDIRDDYLTGFPRRFERGGAP